jgi:hypothetical protein
MSSVDPARLVLIRCTARDGDQPVRFGTGYFVTQDLVLTANHVVEEGAVAVDIDVRVEAEPGWARAAGVVWSDDQLDAALVRAGGLLKQPGGVEWVRTMPRENVGWESTAYPIAASVREDSVLNVKTSGMDGTLYAQGGAGQGPHQLELSVRAAPPTAGWHGISGAPVFVGPEFVGMITEIPEGFNGKRAVGVRADALLGNAQFRLAIAPRWLEDVPDAVWVLALVAEGRSVEDFAETVTGAIKRCTQTLKLALGEQVRPEPVVRSVADALESPERWLQLVRALCKAPVLIIDVTGFQPASFLVLGIRSVVRRGITITTTATALDESELSKLPFNIQEGKLVFHGGRFEFSDKRHRLRVLGSAIKNGFLELKSHPGYLDLPAYDAVRQPAPEADPRRPGVADIDANDYGDDDTGRPGIPTTVLMLCSYQPEYETHWRFISDIVGTHFADRHLRRMRDLASPRLVGQALYEHVRWATTCVVDWTHWRPNVFFELGVRLASAEIPPVSLVEQTDADAAAQDSLQQKARLLRLFEPTVYTLDGEPKPVRDALAHHERMTGKRGPAPADESVLYDGTYQTAVDAFDWRQERITASPHEFLRESAELQVGKDPQKWGNYQVLYASNSDYRLALARSVEERWIAAWYYLRHRYTKDEVAANGVLRAQLKSLGELVLQSVPARPGDAQIEALRLEIVDLIDEFGDP